jgi:putative Mg2+ transporter-C (MgtC) family protein
MLPAYWTSAEVHANLLILAQAAGALGVGMLVGYERSFHGRAAGIRTYGLVCMACCALVSVMGQGAHWFGGWGTAMASNPAPVVQGLMTGIGFLGAGVIVREGFSIRGLSTAASVWATAAVGVLMGFGMYVAAILTAVLVAAVMSGVRVLELKLPRMRSMHLEVRYARRERPDEPSLRRQIAEHGWRIRSLAYKLGDDGRWFEYRLVLEAWHEAEATQLAESLARDPQVIEYRLAPSRE